MKKVRVPRAAVRVRQSRVDKTFVDAAAAEAEAAWYLRMPWAAPRLLDLQGSTLILEVLTPATRLPHWRPAAQLHELLQALHGEGIHHRDVHVGNIVRKSDGSPLLIDWETAIGFSAELSYDLYGPDASGVSVPVIHEGITPQWWGSTQRMSIKNQWRCDVPATEAQRS